MLIANRYKGIYLVTEPGCLNMKSGAYHHIYTGLNHLNDSFEMTFFLKAENTNLSQKASKEDIKSVAPSLTKNKGSYLKGSIKDLIILFKNLAGIPCLLRSFKKEHPDFVYERASYLNPSGLLAARLLSIPHFYEANGLQYQRMYKYYNSVLKPLNRTIEKWSYNNSTHVFFVGSYGNYWRLKLKNWTNVENGIEKDFTTEKTTYRISDGKIHLVFVGTLMQHHRPDILKEALLLLNPSKFHIHLVGSKLDHLYKDLLSNNLLVTDHGFIKRKQLNSLISKFHVGVIAGSPEFNSNMKLFDYALAKCAVVAPNVDVLEVSFKNELLFFDGTANDLAEKLTRLIADESLRESLGISLYNKVKSKFTWNTIFENKAKTIKMKIAK